MLISVSEVSESSSILDRPYLGVVVDNNDPLKLGRVRCTIEGLISDGVNAPWILRSSSSFLGGNTTTGQFAVPEVGSQLKVEFPYADIYAPEYTGYWNGSNSIPSESAVGYPDKVVLVQIGELVATYDKPTQKLEIKHPSGSKITILQNGDIEVIANKDITLNGNTGKVLTTESDPVQDLITGVPSVGATRVKAGMA
jgi:hypothetical protein